MNQKLKFNLQNTAPIWQEEWAGELEWDQTIVDI